MNETTMLSIKEFSEFSGVNQSTLRYYDEIGLLMPASRGKNNYRYYVPLQLIKLNYINLLVHLGVKLSVIKDLDSDRKPESIIDLLSQQEDKLIFKLDELREAASVMHTYRRNISRGLSAEDGVIRIEDRDEAKYALGDVNDFSRHETFYEEFIRFCKSADDKHINLNYPIGGYHENVDNFLKSPGRPDRFYSMDPFGKSTQPPGKYLAGYRRCFYGEFGDLSDRMMEYAQEHDLGLKGPVLEIYLLDEITVSDHEQFLLCVWVGISKL